MIRAVADRIAARARPSYIGRHRRARPVLHRVFRVPLPVPVEEGAR
ncbi:MULTISPECIES: hypothetical protein [Glycomyces]|uniref:Uncharacterized protein n=1 Tax=Glycomyces lechevalierae TaxID=256034 RepID=A0A9X3T024_9ACTN|nr:hypothetical protein [Glycomyces lechevalierae]MDA1388066.1 hypothetical protein [Glycomyces lechevalierae]MDR7338761.1 hypothetical protein [Glycomyces lechevalierae]